jgi:hypothetical protein
MKPSLVLAFAGAIGVGAIGGAGVKLVSSDGYTVAAPPPASTAPVLSEAAAARFLPLDVQHFSEVSVQTRGAVSEEDPNVWFPVTHARYCVTALRAGGACLPGEHRSLTNSDAVPGILALIQGVILPAAVATCPDLSDAEAYAPATVAHVESAGVEMRGGRLLAVGRVVAPALLEGLPNAQCNVAVPAPKEAAEQVTAMLRGYVVPAVRAERGLR